MLPLYTKTMRFVSDPYVRMKKQALIGAAMALALLFVFFLALSSDDSRNDSSSSSSSSSSSHAALSSAVPTLAPALQQHPSHRPEATIPAAASLSPKLPLVYTTAPAHDAPGAAMRPTAMPTPPTTLSPAQQLPWLVRLLLPLVAGYCFGFLGSVPVAGPTSAMVLKLGIQGNYTAALTIAVGGALSEATYAGIAFWGFGSFLAGATFLLPVSKVLGAVMLTAVGIVFLKSELKPPARDASDAASKHKMHQTNKRNSTPRNVVLRNVLLGVTMSGINPALLATYTGAIASVYSTGLLEFTFVLALVFSVGVCAGVSSWFYLLLSLLKKYKQRLKDQTIRQIMRIMGCFLLTLGVVCAKSAIEYFVWGVDAPEAAAPTADAP